MRRLIRADLKRIMAKPGLYIVLLFLLLNMILFGGADTVDEKMAFYKMLFNKIGLTMICIPVYLAVYADELKSGIMISIVGMGLARKKIVHGKLWDCFFLILFAYLLLFWGAYYNNSISKLAITPRQNLTLFVFCMLCVIRAVGVMALASLVLFLTMSASGGMLVLIITGTAASALLTSLQDYTSLPFFDFSFVGLLDTALVQFQNRQLMIALLPALIYLMAVVMINVVIFERKEMNL